MFNFNIAHISDIHIKNNKYVNYENLLITLKEEQPEVIVLTGDIINSVINITTNVIIDVLSFLISLTTIAPIILIPGNHDINCKHEDNDFFTTILKNHEILKPPVCNYWRHSGKYTFMDIIWTVIVLDEHIPEFEFSLSPQILLFHENLDRINTESFMLYNAVLAGHFHTRQIISPNAAYSGSLFQQNIGESHNNHGIIIWELIDQNTTIKEINIKNEYCFLKVVIENGTDVTEQPLPEKILYYDIYHNISTESDNLVDINYFIDYYRNIYNKEPRNIKNKNKYNVILNNNDIIDINNLSLHNDLIKQFLGNDHELLPEILEFHKKNYLSHYIYQETNNLKIRLLNLEFENMYNYETNNKINFVKMEKKLSGIVANNNLGKSSLIDIIIYALYDVHPRTSSKQFIINNNKTNYNVVLEFEIDYKYGIINKKNNKCEFYYDNTNLTKKTINQTLSEIKSVVGSFNDNVITSIQLQYNNNNFVNITNSSRKQKIVDLLSLKIFENIESSIVKQISNYNNYYKMILGYQLISNDEFDDEKIKIIKHQIKCIDNSDYEINNQYNDPNILIYEELLFNQKIVKSLNIEKKIIINNIDTNNNNFNKNEILDNYNSINDTIKIIDNKIDNFKPKYIKDAVLQKYNENGINYLYKLCRSEKKSDLANHASNIANLLLEKDHNMKLKKIIEIDLLKVNNYEQNISKLEEINNSILIYTTKINEISNNINNTDELYNNLFEEHKKHVYNSINENKKIELKIISKKLKLLKTYRQIIKPSDGIISILLNNIIVKIENSVNKLLIDINLDIKIKIENNFDILYSTDDSHWLDISLSSGYQKFIINIIFRLVLWELSDVIILDALIIDEGFGSCDEENIKKIVNLLKWINKQNNLPKLLFIITHDKNLIKFLDITLQIKNNTIIENNIVTFDDTDIIHDTTIHDTTIYDNTVHDNIVHGNIVYGKNTTIIHDIVNDTTEHNIVHDSNENNIVHEITEHNIIHDTTENSNKFYYCEICHVIINLKYKNKHLNSKKHKLKFT